MANQLKCRYIKFAWNTSNGGTWIGLTGLEFRTTVGGSAIALSDIVGWNNAADSSVPNLFDSSTSTVWQVQYASNPSLIFCFNEQKTIEEIAFISEQFYSTNSPTEFDVYYSDDGLNWTQCLSITGLSWSQYETKTWGFGSNYGTARSAGYITAKYFKFTYDYVNSSNVAMAEVELRNSADSDVSGNGTATASGDIGASFVAAKAIDDDANTMWNCVYSAGSTWWKCAFSSKQAIKSIGVKARHDGYLGDMPRIVKVQYSNDDSTYIDAFELYLRDWATVSELKLFNVYGDYGAVGLVSLLAPWLGGAGVYAATNYTLAVASGTFTITGTDVDVASDRTLATTSGSFTLTGTATAFKATRTCSIASGSYTLTGTDTVLTKKLPINLENGEFVLSGTAVDTRIDRKLSISSGVFNITGTSVVLNKGVTLSITSGSFELTGTSVSILCDRKFSVNNGSVSIIGTDVSLLYGREIDTSSGAINITGTSLSLLNNKGIALASGTYLLTGINADFNRSRVISTSSGIFTIYGTDVELISFGQLKTNSGSFVLNGSDITLTYAYTGNTTMAIDSGSYKLTGRILALLFSGNNPSTLAIRLNTKLNALSQYSNFDFNSVCYFNGVLLGANNGGIFQVTEEDDLGEDIESYFEIFASDFNSVYGKFVRSVTVSGVFDKIRILTITDGVECTEHDSLYDATVEQKTVNINLNHDDRGKYIGFMVKNINGSDYSIDSIGAAVGAVQKLYVSESILGRLKVNLPALTLTAED